MVCGGMLCARHSHRANADVAVADGRANLVRAADALENLDNSNPLVKRCVKYIRYLSQLEDNRCKFAPTNYNSHGSADSATAGTDDVDSLPPMGLDELGGDNDLGMMDLLDDNHGLGPYLAAELFDSSMFDALSMPL